ncbi:MAG: class IV adenylate cyclase [Gemmatimonadota bacterium]|nr:class IV adenylate cyclase [Gemmatimonadota bacterium]
MPRNIEIKARIASVAALVPRAAAIANQGPTQIAQDDTFFPCDAGRLKLRAFSDGSGELIFYRRADQQGPKESYYLLSRTADAAALRELMTQAYGQRGRVVKQRTLFLAQRTRIHLDVVDGLGDFLELEVVLEDHESTATGVAVAHEVMASLGVAPSQLIDGAYVDLLSAGSA